MKVPKDPTQHDVACRRKTNIQHKPFPPTQTRKTKQKSPSKEMMFALFSITPAKICTSKRNRKHLLEYL